MQSFRLTLASQSPRRAQLLGQAGYQFDVQPADDGVEGPADDGETPPDYVSRSAKEKAANVAAQLASGLVVGCDTVADFAGTILGKPSDRDHAREMLSLLRGETHHVYSGLCLWQRPDDRSLIRVASSKLKMSNISDDELENYLDSGAWKGKAGAFGFQDQLGWIEILAGDESTVVGLPLNLLSSMLNEFGLSAPK